MAATHYVTLTGPLPAEAAPGETFPLLRWDGDGEHRYALALRDDPANDLAEAALQALGFELDSNTVSSGGWRLLAVRGGGQGPLNPFDGDAHLNGLPPGAPTGGGPAEAVITDPSSLPTLTAELAAGDHNPGFTPDVFGLRLDPATLAFSLRAPDGGSTGLAPGFTIDLVPDQPTLDVAQEGAGRGVTLPSVARLSIVQEPGPAGLLTANGTVVLDDGTGLESPPDDGDDDTPAPADPNEPFRALHLEAGGVAIRSRLRDGSNPVRLEVEIDLDPPPPDDGTGEVPIPGVPLGDGSGGLVRFALGPGGLRARLGPGRAPALALVLQPQAGDESSLELQVEAGLIMGATSLPDARAYLLPARVPGTGESIEFPLQLAVAVAVPTWFRGPVATARFAPFRFDYSDALRNLPGVTLAVAAIDAVQAELGALDASLSDLLGPNPAGPDLVTFRFESDLPPPDESFALGDGPTIAAGMVVTFPQGSGLQRGMIRLSLAVVFDFLNLRIRNNRIYFLFGSAPTTDHFVDLGVFALEFPKRTEALDGEPPRQASPQFHDGWLDLERRELVVAPTAPDDAAAAGEPGGFLLGHESLTAFVPGMLSGLSDAGLGQRFRLTARRFSPDNWPGPAADPRDAILFRVGARGLSVFARGTQDEVLIRQRQGNELANVTVQPEAERGGISSELVVIDGTIRAAELFARMPLPGMRGVVAQATVAVRQPKRGAPPRVVAQLELEGAAKTAFTELEVGFLKLQLQAWRLGLEWEVGSRSWDPSLVVDGTLALSDAIPAGALGGLDDLKKDTAIEVRDLDLLHLNRAEFDLGLRLKRPVQFDLLGGLLLVRLEELGFRWRIGGSAVISCRRTLFRWKDPGVLEVSIGTGPVAVEFRSPRDVRFKLDRRLSVEVRVKDAMRFQGELEWRDRDGSRFFAAGGTVSVAGLPGVTGFLKLGDETKRSGKKAPSQVIFAGLDRDIDVFTGVTLKSFSGGIGYNNRLAGLDDDPNADELLARIDQVHPESPDGWSFVERDGEYFSVVAAAALGSNNGGPDVINAYIAQLIVSVDSDGVAAAAGRVWLLSSLNFTRSLANRDRPVLVGAVVFNPRRRALTAALETRPDPAFELGDSLVAKSLAGPIQASLRIRLTPEVADYFLERVQFSTDLVGIELTVRGSFRVAIFEEAMLVDASLSLKGGIDLSLPGGPGGFSFRGEIQAGVRTRGVVSTGGLMSYGEVDFSADFSVSAYIEVRINLGFRKVERRFSADFASLHVGVAGQGAFAEDGAFGIRGSASVSVRICGHGLSISPGFDYRGDVVDRVRRDVDRYAARLDQLVSDALGGGGPPSPNFVPSAKSTAPTATGETWLLLNDGARRPGPGRFALLPAATGRWLAPVRVPDGPGPRQTLQGDVRRIQVEYRTDRGGTATKELWMPWLEDDELQGQFTAAALAARDVRAELRDAVLATADPGLEGPPPSTPAQFLTDPRVRGESSAFLDEDARLTTPEGVFSSAFRDLSLLTDEEAEVDPLASHPTFRAALEYDRARAAAAAENRTRRDDHDEREQVRVARAAFAALLLDELTRSAPPDRLTFDDPSPDEPQALGLVFTLPEGTEVTAVRVLRDGDGSFHPVTLRRPGEGSGDPMRQQVNGRDAVELFRPRQDFRVVDDGRGRDGRERGTVEVRLPVDIAAELVAPDDPRIDSFQIFRRYPWEDEPRLIAQGVRPVIESVLGSETLRLDPYLYRDVLPVLDRDLLTPGLVPGVTPVAYSVRAARPGEAGVPPGFTTDRWKEFPAVKLFVPPPPPFAVQLGMAFPAEALFRDSSSIALARRDVTPGTFLLVDLSKPEPVPARTPGGGLFRKTDIEIWCEEVPLRQDGFLIGGEAERERAAEASAGAPRRLRAASLLQSIEGKFRVELDDDPVRGGLVFSDPLRFHPGLGYKFFARSRATAGRPGALLAPLEVSYMTAWPDPGARLRLRGAEQYEVIDLSAARQDVFLPRSRFTGTLAGSASDPNHLLRAAFDSVSLLDGGVEVLWRDRDDPGLERRQLCEVLEEGVFRASRADFGKSSGWEAVPDEDGDLPAPGGVDGDNPPPDVLEAAFLPDPDDDPVVAPLAELTDRLVAGLAASEPWGQVAPLVAGWSAGFARYLVSPLNLDDTVARRVDAAADEAVRLLVAGWMPGDGPASTIEDRVFEAGDALRATVARATAPTEAASSTGLATGDDDLMAAIDSRLSRQLAAILTHRLALADELLGANALDRFRTETEVLPRLARWQALRTEALAATSDPARLPRTTALLDRIWFGDPPPPGRVTPFAAMSQMAGLALALVLNRPPFASRAAALARLVPEARGLRQVLRALARNGEELVRRGRHQLQTRRDGVADTRAPVATSFEALLPDAWRTPGTLADLARRLAGVPAAPWTRSGAAVTVTIPGHGLMAGDRITVTVTSDPTALPAGSHTVASTPDADTFTVVGTDAGAAAGAVSYVHAMPDLDPGSVALGAVAFFNLLERLGFATDVAVVDARNSFLDQNSLLERLAGDPAVLAAIPNVHTLLVVAGEAPFSRYRPADQRVGFSFVKVAVVPDEFRPGPVSNPGGRRDWFTLRSIAAGVRDRVDLTDSCLWVVDQFARRLLAANSQRVLFVEPADEQWVTVPAVGGESKSYWRPLDSLGHVMTLAVRRVSRYESLLTWAGLVPTPSVAPPAAAIRSLEVARVFPPAGSAAEDEEPALAAIETTAYPHPTLVQFSFQLPSDGARSLLNAISATRTGFRGTDLGFGYTLPDEPNGPDRSLRRVMEAMTEASTGLSAARPVHTSDLPVLTANRPRLFRNERLVTLPDLAYCYEYTLSARAGYLGRRPDGAELSVLSRRELLPSAAQRSPRLLAVPRPRLTLDPRPTRRLTFEVFLARHVDLLTPAEVAASPPAIAFAYDLDGVPRTTPAPDLPDLVSRYTLIYLQAPGTTSEADVYVRVAAVTPPWSPFHSRADLPAPVVSAIHDAVSLPDAPGEREIEAQVEVIPGPQPAYRVTFVLEVAEDTPLLVDPARIFFVADRGGPESRPAPVEVLP